MVFADLIFLYIFLPINLVLYYSTGSKQWRNMILIAFSLFFYAWGEPVWIILLIASASIDYLHGLVIESNRGKPIAKWMVVSSLVLNLGLLAVFKYGDFIIGTINSVTGLSIPLTNVALPIGISFYTFQTISYTIDVYRGEVKAQRSYTKFLMFVSLYHQLVAGPIVRYKDVENDINHRKEYMVEVSAGITRFCIGLAKKTLIANTAGRIGADFLNSAPSTLSIAGSWLGILLFAVQIYYDFSGYSDMAIGLGKMFGFHYNENFNYPYISKSATEFWRRWHISLGSLFRDYLYIPLGGGRSHRYRNLLITWFATGLWHGASWNFILWGLYYGVMIAIERLFLGKILEKAFAPFAHLYLLFITLVGWVLFYFTDMSAGIAYLRVMFGFTEAVWIDYTTTFVITNNIFWLLFALVFCMPVVPIFVRFVEQKCAPKVGYLLYKAVPILNFILLGLSTAMLVGQSYNPFLYFRF